MKLFIDKKFNRQCFKNMDLQKLGSYYDLPIRDIKDKYKNEFDFESLDELVMISANDIDDYVEDFKNLTYSYTDTDEIEYTIQHLINCNKYDKFLTTAFDSTWNKATGVRFCDNVIDCFGRGYDCSMYVIGSSKTGKYLLLSEYSHDCPTGHQTLIIGLTENEYDRLSDSDINKVIKYAEKNLKNIRMLGDE